MSRWYGAHAGLAFHGGQARHRNAPARVDPRAGYDQRRVLAGQLGECWR
ncbi:hypothetical protein [Microbacterium deminutum]